MACLNMKVGTEKWKKRGKAEQNLKKMRKVKSHVVRVDGGLSKAKKAQGGRQGGKGINEKPKQSEEGEELEERDEEWELHVGKQAWVTTQKKEPKLKKSGGYEQKGEGREKGEAAL